MAGALAGRRTTGVAPERLGARDRPRTAHAPAARPVNVISHRMVGCATRRGFCGFRWRWAGRLGGWERSGFCGNFRKIRRARSGLALRLLGPWGSGFCQGSRSPASSASGAGEPFDPGGSTQFVASPGRFRTVRSVSQVTRSRPLMACVAGAATGRAMNVVGPRRRVAGYYPRVPPDPRSLT